jgi:hypothetical protein
LFCKFGNKHAPARRCPTPQWLRREGRAGVALGARPREGAERRNPLNFEAPGPGPAGRVELAPRDGEDLALFLDLDGALIEDNGASIAVHFRAAELAEPRLEPELTDYIVASRRGLRLSKNWEEAR